MLSDEGVVVELGIIAVNTIDLFLLTSAETFRWIQTPNAFEQTLAMEDFVQAGDAAVEIICRVEEGGIAIRDCDSEVH